MIFFLRFISITKIIFSVFYHLSSNDWVLSLYLHLLIICLNGKFLVYYYEDCNFKSFLFEGLRSYIRDIVTHQFNLKIHKHRTYFLAKEVYFRGLCDHRVFFFVSNQLLNHGNPEYSMKATSRVTCLRSSVVASVMQTANTC